MEIQKTYSPETVEKSLYEYWMAHDYFKAAAKSEKPPFCIVIPPPNVTGRLHMGHALTITIQDIIIRWRRMQGHNTLWLAGTDHAGIATQLMVEKQLLKEGGSRHQLGREAFIERVWQWKRDYGGYITEQLKKMGASLDWSREKFTMDEDLSHAVRTAFVRLYQEGLIYREKRLINWCRRCYTALSDLEVDHKERQGNMWHIKYPLVDSDGFIVVATTRPETMFGDTAVAVNPNDERYQGIIGQQVYLPLTDRKIPIIADDIHVDMKFGSGAVKITPAHDFNDFEVGRRHQLDIVSVIDLHGRINENGPEKYRGLDKYEAREIAVADLEAQKLLVKIEAHTHSVGNCYRCQEIVEPTLSTQWFVKMRSLADAAIEAVESKKTVIIPAVWEKTYFNWLNNIHDWCISRQLWWGHQIPVFYCQNCQHPNVAAEKVPRCEKCGGNELTQDEDVLDTWFSSALWPFSTLGWPVETDDLKTFYPNSVMETGFDIIFFWVARMMMMGLKFLGDVPFKTVYLHAMVRDEKGEKMTKVKGNVIDPIDIIQKYGTDALRFTLASMAAQGQDIKLSLDRVAGYRNFANKIWNAFRFSMMNLEGFTFLPTYFEKTKELVIYDQWILTHLNKTIAEINSALEEFRFSDAAHIIYQFFWHIFCDWYIELVKSYVSPDDTGHEEAVKALCRSTLFHVLSTSIKLLHPFMPFLTEEIWRHLPAVQGEPESIMISPFPVYRPELQFEAEFQEIELLIAVITVIRNIRSESLVSPKTLINVIFTPQSPEKADFLNRHAAVLKKLAKIDTFQFKPTVEVPANGTKVSTFVLPGLKITVLLDNLIDKTKEINSREKELKGILEQLPPLYEKINNPDFMSQAPAKVIAKNQERIAELEQKKEKLAQQLDNLRNSP